jgi:hypothetical protein
MIEINMKSTFMQYMQKHTSLSYEEALEQIKDKVTDDMKAVDVCKLFYDLVFKKK